MYSLCSLGSVSCQWGPLRVPQSPALRSPLGVLAELVTHLRHTASIRNKIKIMFSNNLSNYLSFVLKCTFRMLKGIIVTVLQCSVTMWQPNKEDTKYNKSMGIIIFHQFSLGAELCPTHATLESLPGLANTLGLQGGLHGWAKVQWLKIGMKNSAYGQHGCGCWRWWELTGDR